MIVKHQHVRVVEIYSEEYLNIGDVNHKNYQLRRQLETLHSEH